MKRSRKKLDNKETCALNIKQIKININKCQIKHNKQ